MDVGGPSVVVDELIVPSLSPISHRYRGSQSTPLITSRKLRCSSLQISNKRSDMRHAANDSKIICMSKASLDTYYCDQCTAASNFSAHYCSRAGLIPKCFHAPPRIPRRMYKIRPVLPREGPQETWHLFSYRYVFSLVLRLEF